MHDRKQQKYSKKHILAVDYGTKFTGLANYRVGIDPFILLYGRLKYQNDEQLIREILKIVDEEFVDVLILGIPYFTDGTSSKMTAQVQDFAKKLQEYLSIEFHTQDETLSSVEAQERMQNDPKFNFQVDMQQIDAVAASIILEDFLLCGPHNED